MAKMVKGQLHVTAADLDKFTKDHGLDKPLAPGEYRVTDRNGVTRTHNMAKDLQALENMMKSMGMGHLLRK